jgi:hypothetical protein
MSICRNLIDDSGSLEQGVARLVVSCADRSGDRVAVAEPPRLCRSSDADELGCRGIYGEKIWLKERGRAPADLRAVLRLLIAVAALGFAILAFGLTTLMVWPTIFGASLIVLSQPWRIDRLGLFFEEQRHP